MYLVGRLSWNNSWPQNTGKPIDCHEDWFYFRTTDTPDAYMVLRRFQGELFDYDQLELGVFTIPAPETVEELIAGFRAHYYVDRATNTLTKRLRPKLTNDDLATIVAHPDAFLAELILS